MLSADSAVLVLVDLQERLLAAMPAREELLDVASRLIRGAEAMKIPILHTEHNPAKLGTTVPQVASLLTGGGIPKLAFSCWGEPAFVEALRGAGRRQVLLAGLESHVCIHQTAVDLLKAGYEVQVVTDAVSSRTEANRRLGLDRCKDAGAELTGVEMALFEMLRVAEGEAFRQIVKIVK